MRYNIKKSFKEVRCLHCRDMLNMVEKWTMPDEHTEWTCSNCDSSFKVFGKIFDNGTDNVTMIDIYYEKYDTIEEKTFVLIDNRYFKEVKINEIQRAEEIVSQAEQENNKVTGELR